MWTKLVEGSRRQGSGMPAKKKAPLFFAARKKRRGRDWIFRRKKNQSRLGAPPGQPGRIFFFAARPNRDGTGFFISRAGTGLDFFFRGSAGLGTGLDFFFGTGLDFSLLEQSAEPRSKDSQRKSRPTGKPSSNEKSSPVSEARRGGLVGFFFRGPAGPGRDWFFYFADAKNPDPDFSRGAKNPVPSPLYFAAKKNPVPSNPKIQSRPEPWSGVGFTVL